MTFDKHKRVRSEPFLDYLYELWQLLSALYSDMRKKFYIGAHLCSGRYITAVEFSSKLWAIYTKWGAQTFPPIFGFFAIFDRNFAKIVAPSSVRNKNSLALLKGHSRPKRWKQNQSRPINSQYLFKIYPLERTARQNRSVTEKIDKHHIFKPRAGARSTIFPELSLVIEDVVPIKKWQTFFDPTQIFFLQGARKNRGKWLTRGFSAITPQPVKRITSNVKCQCKIAGRIKPLHNCRNRSKGSPLRATLYQKVKIFNFCRLRSYPCAPIEVKFCTAKRNPRTPRLCQISLESVQWVAPEGRKCWFSASE